MPESLVVAFNYREIEKAPCTLPTKAHPHDTRDFGESINYAKLQYLIAMEYDGQPWGFFRQPAPVTGKSCTH
jgi:hypothetical protein